MPKLLSVTMLRNRILSQIRILVGSDLREPEPGKNRIRSNPNPSNSNLLESQSGRIRIHSNPNIWIWCILTGWCIDFHEGEDVLVDLLFCHKFSPNPLSDLIRLRIVFTRLLFNSAFLRGEVDQGMPLLFHCCVVSFAVLIKSHDMDPCI